MPYNSAINLDVTKSATTGFYLSGANSKIGVTGEIGIFNDGSGIYNGQLLIGASGDNSFIQGDLYGIGGVYINSGSGNLGIGVSGRQTIWLPAGAMSASSVSGAAAGQVAMGTDTPDVISYDFDAASRESALFNVAMPRSWDTGPVYSQFIWSHATGATGSVVWQLQGLAVSDGESLGVAFAGGIQITDASTTGDYQRISNESSAFTISGSPAIGDVVYFRVNRLPADASDDLGIDARLMGLKLIYNVTGATD
jgi:hypothetical protein